LALTITRAIPHIHQHHFKDEILSNHKSVISSFGLSIKVDYVDLSSLYWIPKLHKCPYKERYIAGSARTRVKPEKNTSLSQFFQKYIGYGMGFKFLQMNFLAL